MEDDEARLCFLSTESRALYQVVKGLDPEQLREDRELCQMVIDDFKQNVAERIWNTSNRDYTDHLFFPSGKCRIGGELETFNLLMRASLPDKLIEKIGGGTEQFNSDYFMRDVVKELDLEKGQFEEEQGTGESLCELLNVFYSAIRPNYSFGTPGKEMASSDTIINLLEGVIRPEFSKKINMDVSVK